MRALVHDPASAARAQSPAGQGTAGGQLYAATALAVEPSATGIMLHSNWQDKCRGDR